VLLVVGYLFSAASGQWLERTISLPDSGCPFSLCYSPLYGELYCESWVAAYDREYVAVVDGVSNEVIASVWLKGWRDENINLGCNSRTGKVYGVTYGWVDDYLNVIDGLRDSVVSLIPCQYAVPYCFCYNAQDDKLYWTNSWDNGSVTVFDGGGDTILATVPVGSLPTVLYYCPQRNRV
jgi:DNA-binding beta-propeller fold protein YncE